MTMGVVVLGIVEASPTIDSQKATPVPQPPSIPTQNVPLPLGLALCHPLPPAPQVPGITMLRPLVRPDSPPLILNAPQMSTSPLRRLNLTVRPTQATFLLLFVPDALCGPQT